VTLDCLPVGASPLGTFRVPPSKSLTNRALVAAAAAGSGTIVDPLDSEDTRLLGAALFDAGWSLGWEDDIRVGPRSSRDVCPRLDLGNSGTGARLLLGLLAATPGEFVLDGGERLRERPMRPLVDALRALGADLECADGRLPVRIKGRLLAGGEVRLRPEVSSQFVSSLLMVGPLTVRGIDLTLEGPLPSRPYLDLTQHVLRSFGARIEGSASGRSWTVASGGFTGTRYPVEGDWSAAAFPLAAAAVAGGEVRVTPLTSSSAQGDRRLADILSAAGAAATWDGGTLVFRGPVRRRIEADLADMPDAFPALVVVAACAPAGSVLTGLGNLRHKESDRLQVMVDNLDRIGVGLDLGADWIEIVGGPRRPGGAPVEVTAAADHRIAMAMAVAALVSGPLQLDDTRCVSKSFPAFWDAWKGILP
jgi:3-phosphoshikimate 1-carboxyvinyltransferase